MELVLASYNMHKMRELRALLKKIPDLDIFSLRDFPQYNPVEESGQTFEENAILKSVTAARTLNKWTLADDSGLVVPALSGMPGIFSARYAGKDATDKENRIKLLRAMESLEDTQRQAYFECAIAIASPDGLIACVKGTCEGHILNKEKGGGGFGYDPLFVKHEYSKTFAELEEDIKNKISHRRKALDKIIGILEQYAIPQE